MIAALYVQPDGVYSGLPQPSVITRAEALAAGLTRYYTGKPCRNGHLSDRDVSSHTCGECLRLRSKAWAIANPEKRAATHRKYRSANAPHIAAVKKVWKANNRDKHNAAGYRWRIRRRIELEEFDRLLAAQDGKCAICVSAPEAGKRLAIDHCHVSTKVRGLLCGDCNRVLGIMADDPERLRRAAAYLERLR